MQTCPTKKVRIVQRRAGIRHPCTREAFYPPVGERRADLWWDAAVLSLRTTEVVFVTGRRFEVGTVLEVALDSQAPAASRGLLMRVAQVKAKETNGWVVNGRFLVPLDQDDLEALP